MQAKISNQSSLIHAIIGLGNPGKKYEKTRHNVGFMVLDELGGRYSGKFKIETNNYLLAKTVINSFPSFLIKPITYMNNSGLALRQFVGYYNVNDFSSLLIVLDDFNLPFGTIRVRESGSSGGQKGLEAIIQELNTEHIPRLRIGVGNQFEDAVTHVLSKFSKAEKKVLPDVINFAADAAESFVLNGVQKTMNEFNQNILY